MKIIRPIEQKLCHCKPGDIIQVSKDDDKLYMVVVTDLEGKRPARAGLPHGLYDEQRPLCLVDMETGVLKDFPHKSSRIVLREDVVLVAAG